MFTIQYFSPLAFYWPPNKTNKCCGRKEHPICHLFVFQTELKQIEPKCLKLCFAFVTLLKLCFSYKDKSDNKMQQMPTSSSKNCNNLTDLLEIYQTVRLDMSTVNITLFLTHNALVDENNQAYTGDSLYCPKTLQSGNNILGP